MDTASAFARGEAARATGARGQVFDWDKAARLIRESGATSASAGLSGDWEWTGGSILTDGKPTPAADTYVYLASLWATPELMLGEDGDLIDCGKPTEDGPDAWDAGTYWPASALAILNGEAE